MITSAVIEDTALRPTTRDEVVHCVQQARLSGRPLYPISTGMNWGYGGRSPVRAGSTLLDLSGMNRILNAERISLDHPVAVIEPGVTQAQLHAHLSRHCPGLMFNVTGSAAGSSIVGNALDRGVGYAGPRREDVFGLEFVTGTGQVLQTGFRRLGEDSPIAHCHPYGLGPMLDGLLFQGNFGVVTSACFKLVPRPERQLALAMAPHRPAELGRFIDLMAELRRERVISSVTHIGNRPRTQASLMAGISRYLQERCGQAGAALGAEANSALTFATPHPWTALGGLAGSARMVKAALADVRARLRGVASVRWFDDRRLALGQHAADRLRAWRPARIRAAALSAMRPLYGLATGTPTDAAIDNLLWRFGDGSLQAHRFDESDCGVLYVNPALPMDGSFVVDVLAGMDAIGLAHEQQLQITLNVETELSLVAIVNLLYARSDLRAASLARRCASALHAYIRSRGLEVYRARTDMMAAVVEPDSDYWRTLRQLKTVFDPDNIIAPGRYGID
jgi:4-cresol dehydrogenase (hydroxylating) flavoprotein subunit